MPMAPTSMVTMPPTISHCPPNNAEAPALLENISVHSRSKVYTPTLVIKANKAPTGAVAAL